MSNLPIKRLVVHCAATKGDVSAATIRQWHKRQGWRDIGYHYVIRTDGTVEKGRAENVVGSHVAGWNTGSIAIVYAGGVDANGKPADTRTPAQKVAMAKLVKDIATRHKLTAKQIMGHRDLSPDKDKDGVVEPHEWLKACPSFDVSKEREGWLK
jgi:N-acetyl-anhydromuramyl-L-alanine amidase AmpD